MTNIYQALEAELQRGNTTLLITKFGVDSGVEKSIVTLADSQKPGFTESESLAKAIDKALSLGDPQILEENECVTVIEPYYPETRLFILGGGHIAVPLCEFAARVGFAVTVVDDRPSFANNERFPTAVRVICDSFEHCFQQLSLGSGAYVVLVTRGHRHDLTCLRQIVGQAWDYAGMIGSRKRVSVILNQLLEEGVPEGILRSINMPIGLEIGAVTPEEIAVSIVAQLIACRRLEQPGEGRQSKRLRRTEYDREVMTVLAGEEREPCALVTIVKASGSVPRRAGGKMLVRQDGSIVGSIGGGCSEADVVRDALKVIAAKNYCLKKIDLTGAVAEDEGMVCGGVMRVLIESLAGA
jgi:xanthine dehydrogenase accessory factor